MRVGGPGNSTKAKTYPVAFWSCKFGFGHKISSMTKANVKCERYYLFKRNNSSGIYSEIIPN